MESESTDWRSLKRRRGANSDWREVFYIIYRRHQFTEFDLLDVLEKAETEGIGITHESLRVKLANYCSKEILKKTGRNKFELTDKADEYFNLRNRQIADLLHNLGE